MVKEIGTLYPIDDEHEEMLDDQAVFHKLRDTTLKCAKCKMPVLTNWDRCPNCGHDKATDRT